MPRNGASIYEDLFILANEAEDSGKPALAFRLYAESVEGGYIPALNSLGLCFEKGIGTKKSQAKAFACYKQAARRGDRCGIWNIALCYRDSGQSRLAEIWFRKSLARGDKDAYVELAKLLLKKNPRKALSYLKSAIRADNIFPDARQEAKKLLVSVS